jgi:hypothetical protein
VSLVCTSRRTLRPRLCSSRVFADQHPFRLLVWRLLVNRHHFRTHSSWFTSLLPHGMEDVAFSPLLSTETPRLYSKEHRVAHAKVGRPLQLPFADATLPALAVCRLEHCGRCSGHSGLRFLLDVTTRFHPLQFDNLLSW